MLKLLVLVSGLLLLYAYYNISIVRIHLNKMMFNEDEIIFTSKSVLFG